MSRHAPALLLLALVAISLPAAPACDGFAEMPLPLREKATLLVESMDLHSGANGLVQARIELPADAEGPFAVVASPASLDVGYLVANWAFGGCSPADAAASGESGDPLALCLTVFSAAGSLPAPFELALVVDARGSGRRFTVRGEVAP